MTITPFQAMQAAVDIVSTSPHPVNKIAATLFTDEFSVSRTNHWPDIIAKAIGTENDIGNSSGTIHAETACIVDTPKTDKASLCITDPFCPNCAKNIAEAGIKTIYIDHKGFQKDFFARRADSFEAMSMKICERAGISVYEIWRKDEKIVPIYMAPADYTPKEDSPVTIDELGTIEEKAFQSAITQAHNIHNRRKFCLALAQRQDGTYAALTARAHAVIGYSMQDTQDALEIENPDSKYSFIQEPANRMIMFARRWGYKLLDDFFYCSQIPTSREQVNLVGASVLRVTVGDITRSRDSDGLKAMQQLQAAGIIDFS